MGPRSVRASAMRPKARAARVNRTMTLAPRTEALLEAWAKVSGISRGRIVDMALDMLKPCDACRGRGTVDGPHGEDTERCVECRGDRIIPA